MSHSAEKDAALIEVVAESLILSDALTPNHDGTPEWYMVDAENVEYLVRQVFVFADAYRQQTRVIPSAEGGEDR